MLVKVFTSEAKHEEEDDDIGSGDGTCHTRSLKHFVMFVNYLQNLLLRRKKKVSLKMVLAFFTGGDSIPPLGYKSAVLSFNPVNPYPTASTCAIELTLPSKYRDYEQFKKQLDTAFRLHGGFGLV